MRWPEIAAKWRASNDPELAAAATAFEEVVESVVESEVNAWKEIERRLKGERIILKFSRIVRRLQ